MPDLTTRARREAMDSEDFAALDFLVGAIADVVDEGCRGRRVVLRAAGLAEDDGQMIRCSVWTVAAVYD